MKYFNLNSKKPLKIKLNRQLSKQIKKGHPWIFSDAIEKLNQSEEPGQLALLLNSKKEIISTGIFNGHSNLSFRALSFDQEKIDNTWVEGRIKNCCKLRSHFFPQNSETNCFRLINGEGDGLPGLICDAYANTLVFQTDGEACTLFWNIFEIAQFIIKLHPQNFSHAYQKFKASKDRDKMTEKGRDIIGPCPNEITVKENNVFFKVNIKEGAKTGLFLDQRENRKLIKNFCEEARVLNLFGYTGGFSLYAGLGKASFVQTVDLAPKAIECAMRNWQINDWPSEKHEGTCCDVFEFLNNYKGPLFDLVIVDPPSFAPSKQDIDNATKAYLRVFSLALKTLKKNGIFAASSCSGHIDFELFQNILEEVLQLQKLKGRILAINGQPSDHPYPFACPELRYLKFYLLQIT